MSEKITDLMICGRYTHTYCVCIITSIFLFVKILEMSDRKQQQGTWQNKDLVGFLSINPNGVCLKGKTKI